MKIAGDFHRIVYAENGAQAKKAYQSLQQKWNKVSVCLTAERRATDMGPAAESPALQRAARVHVLRYRTGTDGDKGSDVSIQSEDAGKVRPKTWLAWRHLPLREPRLSRHPWIWVLPLSVALLWVRRPQMFRHPQLWAEDGAVFFQQAYEYGAKSFLEPYAGCYHFLPRLIAYLVHFAPVSKVPILYELACIVLTLIIVGYALSNRIPFSLERRLMLALIILIAPTSNEAFLTITNLQWILSLGLLLLVVSTSPITKGAKAWDLSVLCATGLSGPFEFLFLPLFGFRAWRRRDRHSVTLLVLAFALAALQLIHFSPSWRGGLPQTDNAGLRRLASDFLYVVSRRTWSVFLGFVPLPARLPWLPVVVTCILILGFSALIVYRAIRDKKAEALLFLIGGAAVLFAACIVLGANLSVFATAGDRYFYIPAVTMLWGLALAKEWERWVARVGLALALLSFVAMANRGESLIDYHWAEAARCIGTKTPCIVPINPPGWHITLR